VDGRNTDSFSRGEMARCVGVVPQASSTAFPFTVEEVVSMGRYAHQGFLTGPTKKDREAVKRCLDLVEIGDLAGRRINELSGGEYQRVIIARALAQEPRILLLDEPTAHLDIGHQVEILDLVSSLAADQGLAVGMVVHDLNLAFRFTDRLLLLDRGVPMSSGTTREVFDSGEMEKAFHIRTRRLTDVESGFMVVLPFSLNVGGEV
jgi:iron complex transport system ATP-binding protein